MRILLVNHFPLTGSGSGTYTRNIAEYLLERGHEVCIVFPENIPVEPTKELSGAQLRPVYFTDPGKEPPDLKALPFNFPCFTTHPRSSVSFGELSGDEMDQYLSAFFITLKKAYMEFHPDLIHCQHLWLLALTSCSFPCPVIVTIHGTDLMGSGKYPAFRQTAKKVARLCSAAIAISKDNQAQAKAMFPELEGKLILLPNGFNEKIFHPIPGVNREEVLKRYGIPYNGQKIVLFAGKLTAFKGCDILLRATSLYEKETNMLTLIAGDGSEKESLIELANNLQLKNTYFLGNRSTEELCNLYNITDVFAMPSRREPFGLVALESMACGCPVVATNEGGLPDFVDSESGTLVPIDDAEAFANAILYEIGRTEREGACRRRTIVDQAQQHTQSKFITKLEEIYQSIIDTHAFSVCR